MGKVFVLRLLRREGAKNITENEGKYSRKKFVSLEDDGKRSETAEKKESIRVLAYLY